MSQTLQGQELNMEKMSVKSVSCEHVWGRAVGMGCRLQKIRLHLFCYLQCICIYSWTRIFSIYLIIVFKVVHCSSFTFLSQMAYE